MDRKIAEIERTSDGGISGLLHRISDDAKTLVHDEMELVRDDISRSAKTAAVEAAVIVVGALVAMVGLGFLCTAGVVALEPVIPSLAARLLLGAVFFIVLGGVLAGVFVKRLRKDAVPDGKLVKYEAQQTIKAVKRGIQDEGSPHHA